MKILLLKNLVSNIHLKHFLRNVYNIMKGNAYKEDLIFSKTF